MSGGPLPRAGAWTRDRTRVRLRATLGSLASVAALLLAYGAGCQPAPTHKRLAMVPIGTTPPVNEAPSEAEPEAAPAPAPPAALSGPCTGSDVDALDTALKGCEAPMPRAADVPSTKDKLEISLATSKPGVAPGARLELVLTLRNKSDAALPLFFTGDPAPRFDVEALDASGKRQGRPAGKPPVTKGGDAKGREVKASRFTLAPGGVARVHLAWDAVKLRWAPERQKTWEGHGPPTAPSGPLPRGKYTLRALVPLLGVFERGDVELPKLVVDVG